MLLATIRAISIGTALSPVIALIGSIDIWVPTLNRLTHSWDFYKERQAKGEELWFYTMGRPLEHGLTEPRLMHWASFATGANFVIDGGALLGGS